MKTNNKYKEDFFNSYNKEKTLKCWYKYSNDIKGKHERFENIANEFIISIENNDIPKCKCGNFPATRYGRIITHYLNPICMDCITGNIMGSNEYSNIEGIVLLADFPKK